MLRIYISSLLFCLLATSCLKYVDIKKSGSQSFLETAKDCQLLLDNYELFNTNYPLDGEISADDYYLDDQRYASDLIQPEDRTLYTWQPNAIRASARQWVNNYNKIYHCNLVLEAVAELQGKEPDAILNNIKGSALFLRAYALWPLSQTYMKPFSSSADEDLGIPVHLASDINDVPGRGTVRQTYDAMLKDLKEAVGLLNNTSSIASRPNKAAAYAMLARVHLAMNDYDNALANADAALKLKSELIDFNSVNPGSYNPFPRFNKEVIFHSIIDKQNSVLEVGYGDENNAIINPEIINAYDEHDLRKLVYVKENLDVPVVTGTYRFVGNYEGAVASSALFNGLAVDELFLIRAEAYARKNNVSAALQDMDHLLVSRFESGAYTNMTAANANEALDKILVERRKELLMRGLRWTDLRRLNQETRLAKTLTRTVGGNTYTLSANDARYTLLIPQEVITNSRLEQNGR